MAEIIIANAPVQFRSYLNKGDINGNGKIENDSEAKQAIEAYCGDNHGKCAEIVDYFNEKGYSYDSSYRNNTVSKRKFSLFVTPSLGLGGQSFNYNLLSVDVRNVPPHPDDAGAVTEPIDEPGGTGDIAVEFRVGAMLDFWQYVYLHYQFAYGNVNSWEEEVKEGSYDQYGSYPPHHRQKYASGEDAYTFISTQEQKTHYLTLGFYPYLSRRTETEPSSAFMLEAGLAIRQFKVVRGWDRYASLEIKDTVKDTHLGGTAGIHYRLLNHPGKHFSWGFLAGINGVVFFGSGNFAITLDLGLPLGINL